MLDAAFVYARADESHARRLGAYLSSNCRVRIDYSLVAGPQLPILEAVGRALGSDAGIVLISPESVPAALDREDWEPLVRDHAGVTGSRAAYVILGETQYPKVLLRGRSFDPGDERGLKRWLLRIGPLGARPHHVPPGEAAGESGEIDALRALVADRPGTASVTPALARALIEAVHDEFQGVVWVDARGATLAGVAGELGSLFGMRLTGEMPSNLEALRSTLNQYRCLMALEGAEPNVRAEFDRPGLSSLLLVRGQPLPSPTLESAGALLRAVAGWVNGSPQPPTGQVRRALAWLLKPAGDWLLACELTRASLSYLRIHDRPAEAFELVNRMMDESIQRQDPAVAREFGRERAWILEGWGRPSETMHPFAAAPEPAVQLALW